MNSLLSVKEAAERTGLKETAVRALIRKGGVRVMRFGYHILIPLREIAKLAKNAAGKRIRACSCRSGKIIAGRRST